MVVAGKQQGRSSSLHSTSSSSSSVVQAHQRPQGEAPIIGITAAIGAAAAGIMRKGPWTEQEDVQLIWFVRLLGERRWDFLAKVSGLQRSGKSCRLRWVNYLHPGLKRGRMSPEEERMVVQLHAKLGNRWSRIAKSMPGRTDNEIKNYWRTHLRKLKLQAHKQQQQQQSTVTTPSSSVSISDDDHNSSSSSSNSNSNSNDNLQQAANEEPASQAQQLFLQPLWNDDIVDVDCWSSSTDVVAPAPMPMPMPASPLWDIDDAFCSDYSLPLWGSSGHQDDDYINMRNAS